MIDFILVAVWIGGIEPAYTSCRERGGKGRLESAFDAFIWPMGIGQIAVKHLFDPEV